MIKQALNPHWIGNDCCRDYQIGNIVIKDVPDSYVNRITNYRGGYGFCQGQIEEFLNSCTIVTKFDKAYNNKE